MRSDLVIFGSHINLARRSRRRWLVLLLLLFTVVLVAVSWKFDRWRGTGGFLCFLTVVMNRYLLGGLQAGGLVKPFSKSYRPIWLSSDPPPQSRIDRWFWSRAPSAKDIESDEREDFERDRAHRISYRVLWILMGIVCFLIYLTREGTPFGGAQFSIDWALGVALVGVMLSATLPQAILLWTEPDMEDENCEVEK